MAVGNRKISAASARAHTRKKSSNSFNFIPRGMLKKLLVVFFIGLAAWFYQAIQPPPPKLCGIPGGPPVTSSRIKLSDGRYLAYKESGVPKEKAKYKIVFIHGFDSCRYDVIPVSQELVEELGIYIVSFDRAGYAESDPNPKKTEKSTALDIEELADQLELGSRFYVIGFSMGGQIAWTCLKYIPQRLAGLTMLGPVSNYWWKGFPSNVSKYGLAQEPFINRCAITVAHYAPWLTYWWNSQKWLTDATAHGLDIFSSEDLKILPKVAGSREHYMDQIRQQGEFESVYRDMIVGFGTWEFSPMDLVNPFPNGEASVHLWHGAQDRIMSVTLSRFISQRLPWIHYHEHPEGGHMFPWIDRMGDAIVKSLLLGDQ